VIYENGKVVFDSFSTEDKNQGNYKCLFTSLKECKFDSKEYTYSYEPALASVYSTYHMFSNINLKKKNPKPIIKYFKISLNQKEIK
jgi:hypothetical protein